MTSNTMNPAEAKAFVEDFLASWRDRDLERLMSFFAPDAVYHNVPVDPIEGSDGIRAIFESFLQAFEFADLEVIRIAADKNLVLAERVDHFRLTGGKAFDIEVTGVFEIENGKIKRFSDYFDLTTFEQRSGLKL